MTLEPQRQERICGVTMTSIDVLDPVTELAERETDFYHADI